MGTITSLKCTQSFHLSFSFASQDIKLISTPAEPLSNALDLFWCFGAATMKTIQMEMHLQYSRAKNEVI